MLLHFRGVSGRSGMFLSGKPQQLMLFDDGVVTRQASGWMALVPLMSPGQSLHDKVERQAGLYATGAEYAAHEPRSQFVAYTDVRSIELSKGALQNKLRLDTARGTRQHSYQQTFAPNGQLVPLLQRLFGPAFANRLDA